jgi:hypothetical protein
VLWAIDLANEFSNKSEIVDKCVDVAKTSGRYNNATVPEITKACEEALPTYLNTKIIAMVVIGILVIYFNMVLSSFCMDLVENPSKYSMHICFKNRFSSSVVFGSWGARP